MKKRRYQKWVVMIMFMSFLICCFSFYTSVQASQTIRVGYIDYKGFIEKDSSGQYRGYAVSYLDEIAKYTNWKYRYIYDTWDNCLEKLKKGEIDILCSAQYTKQRDLVYDYSQSPLGNEYTIIYTNEDSQLCYNEFDAMNNKKIGLLQESFQNESLEKYANDHDFTYQKQYYAKEEELIKALSAHEVDMIAVGSLPLHENVKVVAKFDPQPFYVTATEGNQVLLDQVNNAMNQIQNNTPYFEMELFNKFYSNSAFSTQPLLTRQEVDYIQNTDAIVMGLYKDLRPFSYLDKKGNQTGIIKDLLDKVQEKTGLKFEYESLLDEKKPDEFFTENNDRICLFGGSIINSKEMLSHDYWLSSPLLQVDQVIVSKNSVQGESFEKATVALELSNEMLGNELKQTYPDMTIQYYSSIENCLDAVNDEEVSFTISNTHLMNYLIQKPQYVEQLQVYSISLEPISIYISSTQNIDSQLMTIINKAIDSFNQSEVDKIVYNYTVTSRYEYTFFDTIYLYRYVIEVVSITLVLLIVMLVIINKRHTQYLINKKESDTLRKRMEIDKLTGLYNSEFFFEKVYHILSTVQDDFFILYIDIDRFKVVNELYGMETGDNLLISLAQELKNFSQRYSHIMACHFNADKFFVFAPKNCYQEIMNTKLLNQYPLEIEISLRYGVYFITDRSIPINLMCDRAALATQEIKGNYIQRIAIYNDKKRLEILYEQEIMADIQTAITDHQLSIVVQPKYDLRQERIIGGESLVRWHHPIRGNIPPQQFIPIIEANGFVIHLDYFVWEATCQFLKAMKDQGIDLEISVNVSRLNFYRAHIDEILLELIHKYQLEPRNLQLEITESVYSQDTEYIYKIIHQLQSNGFTILMDDFGSGYSSLSMLKDAPVNIIKLDMGFLNATGDMKKSQSIIRGIVNLTHELKMPTIIEGVETQEQVDFLKKIQAYLIQGYYFSKPISTQDYLQLYLKINKKESL